MIMARRLSQEDRDWELFVDWCQSMDLPCLPATADTLADFLAAFPATIKAQGRRVRAIRKRHRVSGQPLHLPDASPRPWREGEGWVSLPQALAQLPVYRLPRGFATALRGRRDGWLLVLIGHLKLSRTSARALTESAVVLFPSLSINGRPIPRAQTPAECPACAVIRWLRVATPASFGWRNEIISAVTPEGDPLDSHDCAVGLDGSWRQASTLLPAIDRYGWVSAEPMSTRAISATIAMRQLPAPRDIPEQPAPRVTTGRFAKASMDELADAYDDVDERAAALLLRLKEIVGEGDEMLDHLKKFDL